MRPEFWRNRKVFVTGHTGFKGSWLCLWLQRLGAEVTGYALQPPTSPSLFEVARVAEGMTSIIGDVRDPVSLNDAMSRQRPEVVIHMAAQPLVRRSYQDPIETYSTNVMGSAHLLEAVRSTESVEVVVMITTDKCYRNAEREQGYRETDPLGGHDPYSNSKACAELLIEAYRDSYFSPPGQPTGRVAVASARAGNVIGGGDWAADRLIPDIMQAFLESREVRIRAPQSVRPWQHVLDPLHGYLHLAEQLWTRDPSYTTSWNFGPDDDEIQTVEWIVKHFSSRWEGARWSVDVGDHPHETVLLKLDCTKAREQLGWTPTLDLATTLTWITDWYRAYQHSLDMRNVTEEQIARFEEIESSAERIVPFETLRPRS